MITGLIVMFAIGMVYATILHICMNRGIEDRLMEAYSSGYKDGEEQEKDDIQAHKDMSYEEGYQAGINDQKQGLIRVEDEDFGEPWMDSYTPR